LNKIVFFVDDVKLMRGKPGTDIKVTIVRKNEES
jgi:C-terminal processing protease CtpA/Prc